MAAVMLSGNDPAAAGVPDNVAVPFPLSVNCTPDGSAPVSPRAGAGKPVVVTVNVPAAPNVRVVLDALVMAGAWLTVCVSVDDVLPRKLELPPYCAVIECVPAPSAAVVNVATPPLRVPVPSVPPPSRNVTVPVGVPPPLLTVAVKVTDWPEVLGLSDDMRAVLLEGSG